MKSKKFLASGIISGLAMLVIILDAKCATVSAREGVDLCLHTVIPSLFPFFVLSGILNNCLLGKTIQFLRPIGKFCGIPNGGDSLLLLGYITGYPVGAQLITQSYKQKSLSASAARHLLGFCNNAGPAFIFGMLSPIFSDKRVPWILWGIHIASGLIVGGVLPAEDHTNCDIKEAPPISTGKALHSALYNIATVCGWVILFRILLGYFDRWFLWRFPLAIQVIISGVLELANGCVALSKLTSTGLKFIIASGMLAFGGICVGMQTQSVTESLGTGYYFPGKFLQTILSVLISTFLQMFLFNDGNVFQVKPTTIYLLILCVLLIICILHRKKVVAFGRRMLYNTRNHSSKGVTLCYFERK